MRHPLRNERASPRRWSSRTRDAVLAVLFGIVMLGPMLQHTTIVPWMSPLAGAAVSIAALLGVMCVFWRTGELRGILLVLFIAALTCAALTGWLLARAM
jgi:hypothetical protein